MSIPNLSDITVPSGPSTKKVTEKLKEKIKDGTYKIGDLIVPQKFEKISLREETLIKEEILVSGRKIPLCDIRKEMLLKHKVFMKLYCDTKISQLSRAELVDELKKIHELEDHELNESDEHMREKLMKYQRTRNLVFWHDGSSLSSHFHILITVACLYETAVFYTDEEYYEMSGMKCNVQTSVEKPFLYILPRSPSNDQQLLYTDERLQDILQIQQSLTTNDGIKVHDVIRAFKGDHPAFQFDSGQQKGGTYPCHGCTLDIKCAKSIPHSFKRKTISLNDQLVKIHSSISSENRLRRNDTIKLYNKLELPNLIAEHQQRNLTTPQLTKQHLQSSLDIEMHGI